MTDEPNVPESPRPSGSLCTSARCATARSRSTRWSGPGTSTPRRRRRFTLVHALLAVQASFDELTASVLHLLIEMRRDKP